MSGDSIAARPGVPDPVPGPAPIMRGPLPPGSESDVRFVEVSTVRVVASGVAALSLLAPTVGHAAEAPYPSRPIRFVVPFPPGGGTDLIARTTGAKLAEAWSQPVVIDNRPGAGTNIGNEIVAKSPPDGYTLLLASFGLGVNTSLYPKLGYDPLRDLRPVILALVAPNVLVANPALPATTTRDLIAAAKAKPGALNYASFGSGTSGHLAAELFKQLARVELTHVPYKGGAASVTALIAGEVQVAFATMLTAITQVKAGRLRALGVTGAKRAGSLPDVPTIAESGLPGYEFVNWYGIMVAAGTPQAIVDRLHVEVARILRSTDARERLAGDGGDIVASTPQGFDSFFRAEVAKWATVVKSAGLRPE